MVGFCAAFHKWVQKRTPGRTVLFFPVVWLKYFRVRGESDAGAEDESNEDAERSRDADVAFSVGHILTDGGNRRVDEETKTIQNPRKIEQQRQVKGRGTDP